jgi:hypothetical protein
MKWRVATLVFTAAVLAWASAGTAQPSSIPSALPWTVQVEREYTPPEDITPAPRLPQFVATVLVERKVQALPASPLFWQMERFPGLEQAEEATGAYGLATTDAAGGTWLMTLGAARTTAPGALSSTQVGPMARFEASEYLLRVTQVGGARGATSSMQSHPGSVAVYVLAGELCLRTTTGQARLAAGQHAAVAGIGTTIQSSSCGGSDLLALVMSVTDASRPFSSPARFPVPESPGYEPVDPH